MMAVYTHSSDLDRKQVLIHHPDKKGNEIVADDGDEMFKSLTRGAILSSFFGLQLTKSRDIAIFRSIQLTIRLVTHEKEEHSTHKNLLMIPFPLSSSKSKQKNSSSTSMDQWWSEMPSTYHFYDSVYS